MTEGDRTAIGIHLSGVVTQPQFTRHRQCLCRKSFIQFNHVHLVEAQPGNF
ncbi:hypothetical protein D3C80_2227280 [compost metagenome]